MGGASTEMENRCKVVLEQVGLLVQALEASLACPEDSHIQLELVNTARTIISVSDGCGSYYPPMCVGVYAFSICSFSR